MVRSQFQHWFWITFLTGLQCGLIFSDVPDPRRVNTAQSRDSDAERALVREVNSFHPLKLREEEENVSTRRSVSVSRVRVEMGEKKLLKKKKNKKQLRKKPKTFLESIYSKLQSFAKITLSTRERNENSLNESYHRNSRLYGESESQDGSESQDSSKSHDGSESNKAYESHDYSESYVGSESQNGTGSQDNSESHDVSESHYVSDSHETIREPYYGSEEFHHVVESHDDGIEIQAYSESNDQREPHTSIEDGQSANSKIIENETQSLHEKTVHKNPSVYAVSHPASTRGRTRTRSKEARGRSLWGVDMGSEMDRLGDNIKVEEESLLSFPNERNVNENQYKMKKKSNLILDQESTIYLFEFSNIVIIVIAAGIFVALLVVLTVSLLCHHAHKETVKACDQYSDVSSCSSSIPDKTVISYNSEGNRSKQSYLCDDLYSLDSDYFLSSLEDISVQI